ncbi:MAG: hypothetical protein COT39_02655 [Parcubacteria group bacterium CG08_land_8_20_14_0_20_48_21]|nr:MAG: hypothetical protein AUK21_00260 [Parcubacteria group bacterium CG2_30_48_51]PIS32787.1 MAG: hypothetical protein COT39_02655 [Parcubacteria group bacterium CG08_land_8_20_14_0_20_48_21]PIW79071.1 MAG: hypothetical protein COZ99_02995 [Parcubacteria group bacterium CG_4_8_14_3_um_filter_48_16]PIY77743.1 MAG: hypothetical protein COY83_03530 [Parcubacteria group bacterium CG_4_10_14_0_8_um_filter_48_154]PIZ77849.1 MAG: hypothetical protein COY03_01490 [bacterium CG_4_10_14_0_2_um_filter_
MCFLTKELLRKARNMNDAEHILNAHPRTCSYIYAISSAFAEYPQGKVAIFLTDSTRMRRYGPNEPVYDTRPGYSSVYTIPNISDMIYCNAKMRRCVDWLSHNRNFTVEDLGNFVSPVASPNDNLQNVIMKPATAEAWITNATTDGKPAYTQKWRYVNLMPYFAEMFVAQQGEMP